MGSKQYLKTTKHNRRKPGKVDTSLDEKLKNVEWGEYRIEDILQWQSQKEIDPLKLEELKDETQEIYPFYGQATINNGIISYHQLTHKVLNNENGKPTILIHSNNQNIVYLETPFYLKDGHGATSVLQSEKLNKINQMFIVASIDKVIKSKYSYNTKATKIELKKTVITLPTQNGEIDFEFMESFMAALETERIADLEAYLLATGLKDYTLTEEEEKVLEEFEKEEVKLEEFEIQTLFEVAPSKSYAMNDADVLIENGKNPCVSNQSQDNGYIGWSNLTPLNPSNVITLSDTWQSERTIFYQPTKFIGKSHLQVMKAYDTRFQKLELFFVISSFRKAILEMNYDYGTKFNRGKINTTKIQLPTINNKIDYALMETFMSAIQKLVIKEVVLYADRKIKTP